jgi:phage terminase small subunit
MAGVKGRSGGARPNSGPKPRAEAYAELPDGQTPLEFLLSVMNDNAMPVADRLKAASTAAQYIHVRKQDGGKRDEQMDKARKVAAKFTPTPAPLKLVNG